MGGWGNTATPDKRLEQTTARSKADRAFAAQSGRSADREDHQETAMGNAGPEMLV